MVSNSFDGMLRSGLLFGWLFRTTTNKTKRTKNERRAHKTRWIPQPANLEDKTNPLLKHYGINQHRGPTASTWYRTWKKTLTEQPQLAFLNEMVITNMVSQLEKEMD